MEVSRWDQEGTWSFSEIKRTREVSRWGHWRTRSFMSRLLKRALGEDSQWLNDDKKIQKRAIQCEPGTRFPGVKWLKRKARNTTHPSSCAFGAPLRLRTLLTHYLLRHRGDDTISNRRYGTRLAQRIDHETDLPRKLLICVPPCVAEGAVQSLYHWHDFVPPS
jgi:hypothetical protein